MSDRPVLGNDPFRRGAAARGEDGERGDDGKTGAGEGDAAPAKAGKPAKKAAPKKKTSDKAGKAAAGKKAPARKAGKKTTTKKAASGKKKAARKAKGTAQKAGAAKAKAPDRPARGPTGLPEPPAQERFPPKAPLPIPPSDVDPLEAGADAVPSWVRTAASTVYHDDYSLPEAPRRSAGGFERALAEAAELQEALGKAVRAAGMGGAHVLEAGEELARTVGRAEHALRSLLGPGLATEVHDAVSATVDAFRHQLLVGRSGRRQRHPGIGRLDEDVDDFGLDPGHVERWRPFFDAVYERWFRVEARGVEHVPPEGRCLLVCNHAGALPWDALMVKTAVEREHPDGRTVRPLMDDFIFHFPFMGTFLNRYGVVRACQENAERLLAQDRLVAAFPEGLKGLGKPYAQRYRLQRFGRGGFVKLSLRAGAPIVPVAIVGSEDVHPILFKITFLVRHLGLPYLPVTPTFPLLGPLGAVPLPSKWHVEFGEPIELSEYGPDAADDRILVSRLSDQVRSRIQNRVDALRLLRRNALM